MMPLRSGPMGAKPFRINPSPAGTRGTTDGEKASPWPGQGIVQAQRTGGPLPNPADIQDAALHGHSPAIPWPKDGESTAKKPFKTTK